METAVAEVAEMVEINDIGDVDEAIDFNFDNLERNIPEPAPAEEICTILNGGDATVAQLLANDSTPVFLFRRQVWEEVMYLTKASPHREWGGFLVLKQFTAFKPKYMAIDLVFPSQEASSVASVFRTEEVEKFYEKLHEHPDFGNHMHCRIAHIHSHHSMSAMWSGTDDNQQLSHDDLGYYDTFRYYLVVNTSGNVRCSYVMYQPLLKRIDNIPVIIVGEHCELTEERKSELGGWIADRVAPTKADVFSGIRTFTGAETEQYVPYTKPVWQQYNNYSYSYGGNTAWPYTYKEKQAAPFKRYDYDYDYDYNYNYGIPNDSPDDSLYEVLYAMCANLMELGVVYDQTEVNKFWQELQAHIKGEPLEQIQDILNLDFDDQAREAVLSGFIDTYGADVNAFCDVVNFIGKHYQFMYDYKDVVIDLLRIDDKEEIMDASVWACRHADDLLKAKPILKDIIV